MKFSKSANNSRPITCSHCCHVHCRCDKLCHGVITVKFSKVLLTGFVGLLLGFSRHLAVVWHFTFVILRCRLTVVCRTVCPGLCLYRVTWCVQRAHRLCSGGSGRHWVLTNFRLLGVNNGTEKKSHKILNKSGIKTRSKNDLLWKRQWLWLRNIFVMLSPSNIITPSVLLTVTL